MLQFHSRISVVLLFIFAISRYDGFGQSVEIDSLKRILSALPEDSNRVNTLIELSQNYHYIDSVAAAIRSGKEAKNLASRVGYAKGVGYAYKAIGMAYFMNSQYAVAYEYFDKAFLVFDSINYKAGIVIMLTNLGVTMSNSGDEPKALEFDHKALTLAEEIGDSLRIGMALNNLGVLYKNNPETIDKGLEHWLSALDVFEKIKYKEGIAITSLNIGEVHLDRKQFDKALPYFIKASDVYAETLDATYALVKLAKIYGERGDFQAAHRYSEQAISIAYRMDGKFEMTQSLLSLAETQEKEGKIKDAIATYKRGESIAQSIQARGEIREIYEGLSKAYSLLGDFKNAYAYQALHAAIQDSLIKSSESDDKQRSQFRSAIQGQVDLKKEMLIEQDRLLAKNKLQTTINYALFITTFILLVAIGLYLRSRHLRKINVLINNEKEKSESLLLNILPKTIADELKVNGESMARNFDSVTVLFTDFKDFTRLAEALTPQELVAEINTCFKAFDQIITTNNIEKIKTIGDSYMAAGGLDSPSKQSAKSVVMAGLEMQDFMVSRKKKLILDNKPFFEMRVGIHTGPVVAGIVGVKKFQYDIWGDTVNTASRMESGCEVGCVNISLSTFEILQDEEDLKFESRGKIDAKNKGSVEMFYVSSTAVVTEV